MIFFRMDGLDPLAVQGTLKCLLQHHSSKASILWCSAFFIVQPSHPYMIAGKTIALTRWTSPVAQLVKNPPAMQETWFDPWVEKIPWRRERLPTPVFWPGESHGLYSPWVAESDTTSDFHFTSAIKSLPLWLSGQKSACSAGAPGEAGSIPGSGRSPGRGCGNLLQYSCLENPMDRGAWQAIVHRIAKTGT